MPESHCRQPWWHRWTVEEASILSYWTTHKPGTQERVCSGWYGSIPCDPAIPLLGIYLEKNMVWKVTGTPLFIAVLFTITKTWKQPECPSTEEWIKKMWYISSLSPIFIAVLFTIAKTWKQPECPSTEEWIKNMW